QCCHECGSLSFDRKLCELFEQNGSLIGCLYRFAGDFEQSVELDRIDAYAVFLDAVLVATTATTFYAVPAAFGCARGRGRCRWCGSRGCSWFSRHCVWHFRCARYRVCWHHGRIHSLPIQLAVG